MKKSILHEALAIAQRTVHTENFRHFTFIVQNNKIVEFGKNNKREPERHYGYHSRLLDCWYSPKTHSEIHAYKKARGILDKKPFGIINIRLNKRNELRISKPCSCCYQIMKELGCSEFYYSCDFGFLHTR